MKLCNAVGLMVLAILVSGPVLAQNTTDDPVQLKSQLDTAAKDNKRIGEITGALNAQIAALNVQLAGVKDENGKLTDALSQMQKSLNSTTANLLACLKTPAK